MNEAHGPTPATAPEPTRVNAIDLWFVRALAGLWLLCVIGSLFVVFWDGSGDGVLGRIVISLLLATVFTLIICLEFGVPVRILVNLAVSSRRHAYRVETYCLAGIFVCLLLFKIENARSRYSLSPPMGVTSLAEFVHAMPPPRHVELHRIKDREYVAWYGDTMSVLTFPSGPSCYLFDVRGQLVHWQPETGDSGPVVKFLSESEKEQRLTVEEALVLTRRK